MQEEKKQKLIRIIGTIVVLVLVIGGVYLLVKKDSQNRGNTSQSPSTENSAVLSVRSDDWIKGKKDAEVIIIEYSDFQCPACGYASTSLDEVAKAYQSDVALVYRHFPLTQHQFAFEAAIASEVAGEAGKFWEMHDALFTNQEKISNEEILNIAEQLGFGRLDFEKKLTESKYRDAVYKDKLEADDLKLDHTPFVFISGVEYTGNLDAASLIDYVKKKL